MENMSVNLSFRARQGQEPRFVLHDPGLDSRPELHDAFAAVFRAVASTLNFEVAAVDPLAVIPPVKRSWNGDETALVDETVARPGDTLHVSWMPDGMWSAEWRTRRNENDVVIGYATSGAAADYEKDIFARSDERAAIEIEELTAAYVERPSPSLEVSGRLRFIACPAPATRPIRIRANADVHEATLRQGVFRATFPIPQGEPETLDLTLLAGGDSSPVTSVTVPQRIPTTLTGAELSVDEIDFSERLFAGKVAKRIRFRAAGYAPRLITLEFRPTAGEAAPSVVHAHKADTTATHVEYFLELDNNSRLSFSKSVPGTMLVSVVGQADSPSTIELVPHLVRAVWEQLDADVQLRIVSGELNVDAILGLSSIFDLRAPSIGTAARTEGRRRFRDPARVVTNVLLSGGISIPLDDRAFTPMFPRDASTLWARSFTLETADGKSFRLEAGNPDLNSLWDQVTSAREGVPAVLSLPGGAQALLALPRNRTFSQRITDAFSCLTKPFGVFFRGFCFEASALTLRPSLAEGGLLVKLAKPVPADHRTRPPVSTFLPFRVLRSVDNDALAFWEPAVEPVIFPIERSLPVGERVGYIYQSGDDFFWARFPDADPACKLKYVTFDGLAFSYAGGTADFEGWWLPDGHADFRASEPFHSYRFDFTEGATSPYNFELKDGVHCTAQGRWLSQEGFEELQAAIVQSIEAKSGSHTRLHIGGNDIDVRWSQRDAQKTILATATKIVDSLEVGLCALP
jgi:hypothetical protein